MDILISFWKTETKNSLKSCFQSTWNSTQIQSSLAQSTEHSKKITKRDGLIGSEKWYSVAFLRSI